MIDDEEVEGLVSTIPQASIKRKEYEQSDAKGRHYQSKRQRQLCMLIFLFLGLAITMFRLLPLQAAVRTAEKQHKQLEYSCPAASTSLSTVNYDENVFASDYLNNKTQPTDIWSDPQTFLNQFREETFDGWSRSYTKFKEDLRPFLQKHVVPLLRKQKPSTIYESACGLGLNLYATLEILQEEANITGITVYGNEYLEENAIKANRILDVLLEAQNTQSNPKNHKGVVCHADSTNLTHVPSASFDLVYTGFLSPMWDPLNFGQEFYKNYKLMKRMCNEQEDDWQSQKLVEVMQEKQDAWFATWAGEMIRIAKPGSSVIVEEISLPLCEAPTGWGGVPKDFWEQAISKYKWDVDPSSIAFGSRKEGPERRYHVFMQKNF